MKFQSASVREIKRVFIGSCVCGAVMVGVMLLLCFLGVGSFNYTVPLSAAVGILIATGNFALLCLTIQKAAETEDQKQMKARFQLSYNGRLIAQAAWVVVAYLLPCFHVVAAALPLLFPTVVIFVLNKRGTLVTPSDRKNPEAEEQQEESLDSFEV